METYRNAKENAKLKLVIDCDAGIDDAQAIMIALSQEVDILGITCTFGNVDVDQVIKNVFKVLEVCGRTDIPVYKGAYQPLLGSHFEKTLYHGMDGLGDASGIKDPENHHLPKTHAAQAMVQIINDNPAEVVIVALGPLTNLALASHLDAEFTSKVKQVFVMGGCIHSKGNHTVTAEFNFCVDPEAAHIFLNEFKCPISLVSWEMCLDHPMEWEFFDRYLNVGTKKSDFMKKISTKIKESEGGGPFIDCDPFPLCAAIKPEIVLQEKLVHATVEVHGSLTRGQMVVDWGGKLKKECNVRLLEKMDLNLFMEMMLKSVE